MGEKRGTSCVLPTDISKEGGGGGVRYKRAGAKQKEDRVDGCTPSKIGVMDYFLSALRLYSRKEEVPFSTLHRDGDPFCSLADGTAVMQDSDTDRTMHCAAIDTRATASWNVAAWSDQRSASVHLLWRHYVRRKYFNARKPSTASKCPSHGTLLRSPMQCCIVHGDTALTRMISV